MGEKEEVAYSRGERAAYIELLGVALRGLHRDAVPTSEDALRQRVAQLEALHAETIQALRAACAEHGDNDWSDDLHPKDIVRKHLFSRANRG